MEEVIKPSIKSVRIFFLVAGIVATIAYRIIILLNFYSPYWVKISWYIGTIGFILYFGHRFEIQRKRANLIKDYGLINKVKKASSIKGKDKQALLYIVRTTLTSRSQWNSGFIFILSLLALILGIILDLGIFG